jgi:hypothetical protein
LNIGRPVEQDPITPAPNASSSSDITAVQLDAAKRGHCVSHRAYHDRLDQLFGCVVVVKAQRIGRYLRVAEQGAGEALRRWRPVPRNPQEHDIPAIAPPILDPPPNCVKNVVDASETDRVATVGHQPVVLLTTVSHLPPVTFDITVHDALRVSATCSAVCREMSIDQSTAQLALVGHQWLERQIGHVDDSV